MNNDELIAAGHELAKCLDSNTPLLDIAKMIVRLADKLDVTTLALREKTKQCEQLAAENAALKSWAEKRAKSDDALEQERYSTLKIDYRQRMLSNIQTPATDAFLSEVRAKGVEEFVKRLRDSADIYDKNGRHEWADHNRVVADDGNVFAAELRQGGAA
ncbi:hypothetical protein SNQ44_002174 [Cronobacter sakazakii]|uniref:hypothetical protein n=1 Tax=Cronobacter sakazakii TaxID=28141 RepID=UPI0009491046|nr:hypothetical protein [Cronobacter sakazakii]ELY2914009.1 hypothetical protein [Cronobacter sakazakii]ELY4205765.1 hypothetical protein [Cronobacter sakazakii]ELY5812075.1 hypothetical protein [Cronobacter sakazakii]ELY6283340.1 hypothetical protein [Cronobacter sakazakii]ELY7467779.1 hypothetical protein [Cronobacter sakazakii]